LGALVDPHNDLALEQAMSYPNRGIGERTFESLREAQNVVGDRSFYTLIKDQNKLIATAQRNLAYKFLEMLDIWQDRFNNAKPDQRAALVANYLDSLFTDTALGEERNYKQMIKEDVAAFFTNPDALLDDYLLNIALQDVPGNVDTLGVKLMTMHSAKGLEFPYVFVTGMEENVCPWYRSDVVEERRLAYVAMTRAKDRLYLTWAQSRYGFRAWQSRASRFIEEAQLV
jgi:DNA helicase-2/ATP-dependent DNA helicase PcrA